MLCPWFCQSSLGIVSKQLSLVSGSVIGVELKKNNYTVVYSTKKGK